MSASPVVPGYELRGLLGSGATASVWAARAADGRAVAVKVADAAHARTVRGEAALLARLAHPGVVASHEVVETAETAALVLDLVPGGTLADRLARRCRLPPAEVVELGAALAAALAHLHGQGIVHGDVKPHNVLLDDEGRPVLCDLGTAAADDLSGTPGYTPDAVLAGRPPAPADDVHALAVVLQEALAGCRPGPDVPLGRTAPGTPPALCELVERALAGRVPTATALGHELATIATAIAPRSETRTFGPRPPREEPPSPGRTSARARRLAPVAAAALVAAVLAGPLSPGRGSEVASAASPAEVHLVTRLALDWDGAVLTAPDGTRYTLGVTGGQVVLGDWDCDGRRTPAHYEPATGAAVLFAGWASGDRPVGGQMRRLPPGGTAVVARDDGCDRLVVVG